MKIINVWIYTSFDSEPSSDASRILQSPMMTSRSSTYSQCEQLRSPDSFLRQNESFNWHGSHIQDLPVHASTNSNGGRNVAALSFPLPVELPIPQSRVSMGGSPSDPWAGISRSSQSSCRSSSTNYEEISNFSMLSLANYEEAEAGSVILTSVHDSEKDLPSAPSHHYLVSSISQSICSWSRGKKSNGNQVQFVILHELKLFSFKVFLFPLTSHQSVMATSSLR